MTVLHMDYCNIGDHGGALITNAVRTNKYMRDLSLKGNGFKDQTGQAFGKVFEILSSSLEILDLSENEITDKSAKALKDGLVKNRQLRHLDLTGNFFTVKVQNDFLRAVRRNEYITHIALGESAFEMNVLE